MSNYAREDIGHFKLFNYSITFGIKVTFEQFIESAKFRLYQD